MSSLGRVLIVGEQGDGLHARLTSKGYFCEMLPIGPEPTAAVQRPDAIIVSAAPATAQATIRAVKKHPALKLVPLLVDASKKKSVQLEAVESDDVAKSMQELETKLEASIRARRVTLREELVRSRLELLLEITRASGARVRFHDLVRKVSGRLKEALSCEQATVLVFEGNNLRKAYLLDSGGRKPVEVALSPAIRAALETSVPQHDGETWIQPVGTESNDVAALIVKRATKFEQEEQDFMSAVGAALNHAIEDERAQDSLARARETLEAAYVERYRELVEANQRLKSLDRKKNEMLAVLSHDLRGPLNVLLGQSWILIKDEALPKASRESAEAIQRVGKKALALVESLLEQSRPDDQRIALFTKKMDVAETCQDVVRDFTLLAKQQSIALKVEAPMSLMVLGDELKIRQVIQNLVTNALKHAKNATSVSVRARLRHRPDGNVAHIEVRDDGNAVDQNELLLAFENSRGLGLSICREYVERHGGEIWAEAPKTGGAMFVFTLPIHVEAPVQRPVAKSDAPLILIADDDPIFARICSLGLASHYRIESARNGNEALDRAIKHQPDVVVMDVFMPERDGLDTLRRMHEIPETAHIPVILVSRQADLGEKLKSLELGPVEFLRKPVPLSALLTKVAAILQRQKSVKPDAPVAVSLPGNDSETGLFDHLGLVNRLDQEIARTVRYARPLTLASLKPVAAVQGKVKELATIIRKELRVPDVIGHLGSGVFAVILPETSADAARPIISRLCAQLEETGVVFTSRVVDVRQDAQSAELVLEQILA